jgi:cobalt-precorrin 5A hydrolase
MKTYCLAFTDKGEKLAKRLEDEIGAYASRCNEPLSLSDWTEKAFAEADNIIYIGAAGIAVRAIAKHVVSKVTDPAVLVIDECGDFVISLLSGHIGGANDLAARIAASIGATPVITTATDRNGVFAVDEWAKRQDAMILEPEKIKSVSSALLAGEKVGFIAKLEVSGEPPENVVPVTSVGEDGTTSAFSYGVIMEDETPLHVVPKIVHLGIGCRKGTDRLTIENVFASFKKETGLIEKSIADVSSIDVKAAEPGILEFTEFRELPFITFSKDELAEAEGDFDSSEFVKDTVGVDNVCERAAVRACGGKLLIKKYAENGVTFAAAIEDKETDWRWKDE